MADSQIPLSFPSTLDQLLLSAANTGSCADKKATSKALSFLPRGTAGASRVTLISGVE